MAGSASGRVVGNWVCLLVLLVLAGALGACGEEAALSELAASEDTAEPVTVDDVGEGEDPGSGEEDAGGEPAPPSKRLTGEGVQVSATLGGEGGKVEVDDGSAEVAFEPESLGEETRVSVTRFDVANGAGISVSWGRPSTSCSSPSRREPSSPPRA